MNVSEQYKVLLPSRKKTNQKTISGYKKTKVIAALRKSLVNGDVSRSIQWAVELHMSRCSKELWNVYLLIMSKHIHRENPLLPVYMERQWSYYLEQITEKEPENNQQCRNRIAEITAVLTLSHKCKLPTIKKTELNSTDEYKKHLVAPSMDFVTNWRDDDLLEIRTACNELAFQLSKQDHTVDTQKHVMFWFLWISNWDKEESKRWRTSKRIKKNRTTCFSSRPNKFITKEFASDYVWLLWNIVLQTNQGLKNNNRNIICQCLFRTFCRNYTTSKRSKHMMYLQHAILVCLDTVPQIRFNQSVFTQYSIIIQSDLNINLLYADVDRTSSEFRENANTKTPPTQHEHITKKHQLPEHSEHPYLQLFMENELYNNPQYHNKKPQHTDQSVLHHLDKFFSVFDM